MKDSVRDSSYCRRGFRQRAGYASRKVRCSPSLQGIINSVNKELLAVAESLLLKRNGHLYGYEVDFRRDDMVKGNAYGTYLEQRRHYIIESGLEEDVYLDYFVPEIGGNIWFDGGLSPKGLRTCGAAEMFINFMWRPRKRHLYPYDLYRVYLGCR